MIFSGLYKTTKPSFYTLRLATFCCWAIGSLATLQKNQAQNINIAVQNVSVACQMCMDLTMTATSTNFGCSSWVIDLTYNPAAVSAPIVTVNPLFNDNIYYTTIVNTTSNERLLLSNVLNPPTAPFQITATPIRLATICFSVNNAAISPNFSIINTETYVANQAFTTLLAYPAIVQPNFPTLLNPTTFSPSLSSASAQMATLQWAAIAAAANCQVRYKTLASSSWTEISLAGNATSIILEGLTTCTTYEAQLRAVCANGNNNNYGSSVIFNTLSAADWTLPPAIRTCDAPLNLNNYLSGNTGGTWSGLGVSSNLFNPAGLAPGNYAVTYTIGAGNCQNALTQNLSVSASPNAQWTVPAAWSNCGNAIDLNTLLTGSTGGTWSGSHTSGNSFIPLGISPGTYELTYTVGSGTCATSQTQSVSVVPCTPLGTPLRCRMWLQGAYQTSTSIMTQHLRTANLLPLRQPYYAAPWYYSGEDSVINAAQLPATMVDWVLLELCNPNTNEIIARKAGCLLANGTVGDVWGNDKLYFNAPAGDYRLLVRHRNHIALASATVVTLPNSESYDFGADNQCLGGNAQTIALGTNNTAPYALAAGDMDGNGVVNVADFNVFATQSGPVNQYHTADVSLNGISSVYDFNLYQPNNSRIAMPLLRY